MAKRKRKKRAGSTDSATSAPATPDPVLPTNEKPLRIARALSVILVAVGAVFVILGVGVTTGMIKDGWGFPMSAVPNWGRPWGLALLIAGAAYIVGPIRLWMNPRRGAVLMMIVLGAGVLIGTPVIQSAIEIAYNLFQETKSRPAWVDSVWAYFMALQIGTCAAIYKAYPAPAEHIEVAGAR